MHIISARVRVTIQYDVSILINIGTKTNSLSGACCHPLLLPHPLVDESSTGAQQRGSVWMCGYIYFFLHMFGFTHFHFKPFLQEGQAGKAWVPSNKVTLCPPPPTLGVTSASYYIPPLFPPHSSQIMHMPRSSRSSALVVIPWSVVKFQDQAHTDTRQSNTQ